MIPYHDKEGVILCGHKRICIRCKPGTKKVLHRKFAKGQNIFLNYNEDESLLNKDQVCSNVLLFD